VAAPSSGPRRRLAAWAAALAGLLLAAGPHAAAAGLDRSLVSGLAARDLRAVEAATDALAATGDPAAAALLRALRDGRLVMTRDGRVLRATEGGFVDAAGGEPVTGVAPSAVREIRISNRIRRAISAGLAELSLAAPDPAARLAAARQLLEAPVRQLRPRLEAALAREPVPRVRAALRLPLAAITAADPDAGEAARRAAIEQLEAAGTQAARAQLLRLSLPPDSVLEARRRAAVAAIDRSLARWAWLQHLWHGLSLGSVLLLAALGLAITFGVMGVINMAHGEMVMIGAYSAYGVQVLCQRFAPGLLEASLLLALPLAFMAAGLVGVLVERTVVCRLYGRPLETLLATFGVSLILQQSVRSLFGAANRPVDAPAWLAGAFQLGQLTITYNRLSILLLALAALAGLALALRRTRLGLQIRAVTQNRRMAEELGIRSGRIDMATFGLGSGIAGIAGVALSQIENVSPNLGQAYIIDSFMVIVLGGVGNLAGTLLGAMTLGLSSKAVEPWLGAVAAKVMMLVLVIVFIQFRPQGLFPQRGRTAQ